MDNKNYLKHRERLRKRYLESGINSLHDYEKLELLLTYCISRKDVKPFAKELMAKFRSFSGVVDSDVKELSQVKGIGENSALLIKLIRDLSTVYLEEKIKEKDILSSPQKVVDFCRLKLGNTNNEKFMVIFVNSKNEFIEYEIISEGTINSVPVYPRKIVEFALEKKASGVVLVHNHPSGNTNPSKNDDKITEDLVKISESLDIRVLDHIIVSKHSYYSYLEEGLI